MAYKTQVGAAQMGGALTQTGRILTDDDTEATSTTDGALQTDGGLSVVKSAVIGDDLDLLSDGAIVNIGSTSKFTLTDQAANNCVMATSGHRLAFGNAGEYISGDGNNLDIISSGDLDITATLVDVTGAGTFSGILKTDDTTEATSTTDGSLQTDGGLSVAKSAVIGDDLDLLSDSCIMNFGSTSKFTLTDQAANNCLMATSGHRLAFGDAGDYITGDGTDLSMISSGDIILGAEGAQIKPASNDQCGLGIAGTAFSDLFLAEGGVINWDSGDATLTQASDVVTLAGATFTGQLTNALSIGANGGLALSANYDNQAAVTMILDIDGLSAEAPDLGADSFGFDRAGVSKKMSFGVYATAIAGSGLTAKNGVLSVQGGGAPTSGSDGIVLSEGYNVFGDIGSSATVYLPGSPDEGDQVWVKVGSDVSADVTLSITGSGSTDHTMDGQTKATKIESPYGAVGFIYYSGSDGKDWRIL